MIMGMLAMKALMVSSGVVSVAVILILSLPLVLDFMVNELPVLWSTISVLWLKPTYIYVLINCIILSIVASSKLHPRGTAKEEAANFPFPAPEKFSGGEVPVKTAEVEEREDGVVVFGYVESDDNAAGVAGVEGVEEVREEAVEESGGVEGGDEFTISKSMWSLPEDSLPAVEGSALSSSMGKPRVSARFGNRRGVKASPEGKTKLKVSRPKRQETLESTWRTLTEGRPMPLNRHLRKSDTFAGTQNEAASPVRIMKKSDTFSGNASPASGGGSSGGGRLRREASLSQDELNRRVEAFIKKFNEEMRLQRQESFSQYSEVIGRGVHA